MQFTEINWKKLARQKVSQFEKQTWVNHNFSDLNHSGIFAEIQISLWYENTTNKTHKEQIVYSHSITSCVQ